MSLFLTRNSHIDAAGCPAAVMHAVRNIERDIAKVFLPSDRVGIGIRLCAAAQKPECFSLVVHDGSLELGASDDLGFIYGLYEISRSILGIGAFWFWNDQQITPREAIPVAENFQYQSEAFRVRYRGWFVNDEVLISAWRVNGSSSVPWEMVFEALLRCGGNMVIPGTDRNSRQFRSLASSMGLYITHHHAEPLGAEMFAHAYPDLTPSYASHPDKFQKLWQQAIQEQKDIPVIWNLGFRGQGDCPFWENDPQYQTAQSRGRLISDLIRIQYRMVKAAVPDAVCCTNLYGETMELYQNGNLQLPEDIIRIWADNGYGKMVTRRQWNHNPRICSVPDPRSGRMNGIYYHVSFYDLQAANHITMLPNSPDLVKTELETVLAHDGDRFWLVNCSNVKPHVYLLDYISELWRTGTVDTVLHRTGYVSLYYGTESSGTVSACLEDYFSSAVAYGPNEDDHAGEQFANHVARILISQYMKNKDIRTEDLLWATDAETLSGQISWYLKLCRQAQTQYRAYLSECEQTAVSLTGAAHTLFCDSLLLQAQIYFHCFSGAVLACESLLAAFGEDFRHAFYDAGKAAREYRDADTAMRKREHGKWSGFYANECLTDVKQTAWLLDNLMGYVRNLGDGPHFYQWQREFLYAEEDARVMLIMNLENHLTDNELFALMDARWGQ